MASTGDGPYSYTRWGDSLGDDVGGDSERYTERWPTHREPKAPIYADSHGDIRPTSSVLRGERGVGGREGGRGRRGRGRADGWPRRGLGGGLEGAESEPRGDRGGMGVSWGGHASDRND